MAYVTKLLVYCYDENDYKYTLKIPAKLKFTENQAYDFIEEYWGAMSRRFMLEGYGVREDEITKELCLKFVIPREYESPRYIFQCIVQWLKDYIDSR